MGQQNNKYNSVGDMTTGLHSIPLYLKENPLKIKDLDEIKIIYTQNTISLIKDGKYENLDSTVLLKDKFIKNLVIIFQINTNDTSKISTDDSNLMSDFLEKIEGSIIENFGIVVEDDEDGIGINFDSLENSIGLSMNNFLKTFKRTLKIEIKNVCTINYDSKNVLILRFNNNTNNSTILGINNFVSKYFPSFCYEINSIYEHFSDSIKCYFEQIINIKFPKNEQMLLLPNIFIDEAQLSENENLVNYLYTFNCFLKYLNDISEKTKSIVLNITIFKMQSNGVSEKILSKILRNLKSYTKILIIFDLISFDPDEEIENLRNYFYILINENSVSRMITLIIKKKNRLIKQIIFNYNIIEPLILSLRKRDLLKKITTHSQIFGKIYNFLLDDCF
jgi:hypothetical protein